MTLARHSKSSLADQTLESARRNIEQELTRQLDMQHSIVVVDWDTRVVDAFAESIARQFPAAPAERQQELRDYELKTFVRLLLRIFPFLKESDLPTEPAATFAQLTRNILHAAGHDVSLF